MLGTPARPRSPRPTARRHTSARSSPHQSPRRTGSPSRSAATRSARPTPATRWSHLRAPATRSRRWTRRRSRASSSTSRSSRWSGSGCGTRCSATACGDGDAGRSGLDRRAATTGKPPGLHDRRDHRPEPARQRPQPAGRQRGRRLPDAPAAGHVPVHRPPGRRDRTDPADRRPGPARPPGRGRPAGGGDPGPGGGPGPGAPNDGHARRRYEAAGPVRQDQPSRGPGTGGRRRGPAGRGRRRPVQGPREWPGHGQDHRPERRGRSTFRRRRPTRSPSPGLATRPLSSSCRSSPAASSSPSSRASTRCCGSCSPASRSTRGRRSGACQAALPIPRAVYRDLTVALTKAVADDRQEAMDAPVRVEIGNAQGVQQVVTVDPGKDVAFNLPPGSYQVLASCEGHDAAGPSTQSVDLAQAAGVAFAFRPRRSWRAGSCTWWGSCAVESPDHPILIPTPGGDRAPGGYGTCGTLPDWGEQMTVSEQAGRPAEASMLVDVDRLVKAYYEEQPDPGEPPSGSPSGPPGTGGRRSTGRSTRPTSWPPPRPSAATARPQGIDGPLFLGRDTHALSEPA